MKKAFFLFTAALMVAFTSCDNDRLIESDRLPEQAQQFIKTHFPDCGVHQAVRDHDEDGVTYDVYLSCAIQLEFDKSGEWIEVNCAPNQVPDAIVPDKILSYVKTNYPDEYIVKIEKERVQYDVRLNNRVELKFDRNGNFLHIDL